MKKLLLALLFVPTLASCAGPQIFHGRDTTTLPDVSNYITLSKLDPADTQIMDTTKTTFEDALTASGINDEIEGVTVGNCNYRAAAYLTTPAQGYCFGIKGKAKATRNINIENCSDQLKGKASVGVSGTIYGVDSDKFTWKLSNTAELDAWTQSICAIKVDVYGAVSNGDKFSGNYYMPFETNMVQSEDGLGYNFVYYFRDAEIENKTVIVENIKQLQVQFKMHPTDASLKVFNVKNLKLIGMEIPE